MARKPQPLPKICDRCEAFFPSIGSATCPQCFAPLTALTEEDAVTAAQQQLERLKDPEYLEKKALEDEKFKENSFGACLGVLGSMVAAAGLSILLITIAAHQHHHVAQHPTKNGQLARDTSSASSLLPSTLGNLRRDPVVSLAQPGSNIPIYHCVYGNQVQIYTLPRSGVTNQSLSSFRLAVSLVCNQTVPPLVSQETQTKAAVYAVVGENGGLVGDVSQRLVNLNDR